MPGVERKMLDRVGDEVARATSIVRYAPNSRFSAHTHGGGEEFLVLQGVFSDEHGDYSPGTYVRNPVGSCHTPHSEGGCTLFVKLHQFQEGDAAHRVIDTRTARFQAGSTAGVSILPLHEFGTERVTLVRWAPGSSSPRHHHVGGVEVLVLEGVFQDENGRYPSRSWIRGPDSWLHAPFSDTGCLCYVKSGHLTR
jgi:anti-sigma factor ChrR (cupin superfamily)